MKDIILFLDNHQIKYSQDVALKNKTWIHRGGIAKLFIEPSNKDELIKITQYLYKYKRKQDFTVIGCTSNLYIRNSSNLDIVISTLKCNSFKLCDNIIHCEAGANVAKMSRELIKSGVKGFEYLTRLPGTIGGAIYNNSSCKENSIAELIVNAVIINENGELVNFSKDDFDFSFRTSILKEKKFHGTIISVDLKANYTNSENLLNIAEHNDVERKKILETNRQNLGCTVNRPFILGKMPLKYSLPLRLYNLIFRICNLCGSKRQGKSLDFLCWISGYSDIKNYISKVNPIIFIWNDDMADNVFDRYIEFMNKVYRTDKIEIEII